MEVDLDHRGYCRHCTGIVIPEDRGEPDSRFPIIQDVMSVDIPASPPREIFGLREAPGQIRLPLVEPDEVPVVTNLVPAEELQNRYTVPTSRHPLAPGRQVIETDDGPRGPNPIPVDSTLAGPAEVLPVTASDFAAPSGSDAFTPLHDPNGPALAEIPPELAELPGPGQGRLDPDSRGPLETGVREE